MIINILAITLWTVFLTVLFRSFFCRRLRKARHPFWPKPDPIDEGESFEDQAQATLVRSTFLSWLKANYRKSEVDFSAVYKTFLLAATNTSPFFWIRLRRASPTDIIEALHKSVPPG